MIIEDEPDAHGAKASATPPHAPGPGSSALGHTQRETNRDHSLLDAEAALDAPPSYDETTSLLPSQLVPRARQRFARAFVVALLVSVLGGVLFGSWTTRGFGKVRLSG
jgi:hypothetical protein